MLEHLRNQKRGNYGPGQCKLQRLIDSLESADKQILEECLADQDNYSTNGIFRGLKQAGIQIGYLSVQRHRDSVCACDQNA